MKTTLGLRISELRKKRSWLQRELAEKIGMSTGSIAMWETGKRDPDSSMLAKLAAIFEVSTDFLLGISDDPSAETSEPDGNLEPEIRVIQRAAKNMSPTDRKKMLNMVKAAFEEAFSEDD